MIKASFDLSLYVCACVCLCVCVYLFLSVCSVVLSTRVVLRSMFIDYIRLRSSLCVSVCVLAGIRILADAEGFKIIFFSDSDLACHAIHPTACICSTSIN